MAKVRLRTCVRIVGALICGAISEYAFVFVFAPDEIHPGYGHTGWGWLPLNHDYSDGQWDHVVRTGWLADSYISEFLDPSDVQPWRQSAVHAGFSDEEMNPLAEELNPEWRPSFPINPEYWDLHAHQIAGWPFRCVVAGNGITSSYMWRSWKREIGFFHVSASEHKGWLRFQASWDGRFDFHIRGPAVPMLGPLALNSMIFGTVWWFLLPLPWRFFGALRRALRRRAGKCVKCKYDLTGIDASEPCPECGRMEKTPSENGEA